MSLNQGWTYFKEKYGAKNGKLKIKTVSISWKNTLSSVLSDFSYSDIDLQASENANNLAIGYELGHICGKYYPFNSMPSDEILKSDLRNLLGVYRELKGKLIDHSIEKTNNHLIVNHELGLTDNHESNQESSELDRAIENFSAGTLMIEEPAPHCVFNKDTDALDFSPKKTDFIKKAKQQKKLGYAGEIAVFEYERKSLIEHERTDLAAKVRHVSLDDGDGAGYDILSFEPDGKTKYIEVKTTTGSKTTPFIITSNELAFSQAESDNYMIYRLYEFAKAPEIRFYKLIGDMRESLNLKPQQYIAYSIGEGI